MGVGFSAFSAHEYIFGALQYACIAAISSKSGKARKAHFNASSVERRVLMSAPLSKELRKQYNVRSLPIRKEDEVCIVSGTHADTEGKVVCVYRRKWVVHVNNVTRENKRGEAKQVGIRPSNVVITKLHIDKDRKALLARKNRSEKITAWIH